MWMVGVGVLLVALKWAGLGFVGNWSWWLVLAPFVVAAAWWQFADSSGITQRAAMRRHDARAEKRRLAQFEALGLRPPGKHASRPAARDKPESRHDSRQD